MQHPSGGGGGASGGSAGASPAGPRRRAPKTATGENKVYVPGSDALTKQELQWMPCRQGKLHAVDAADISASASSLRTQPRSGASAARA